MNAPSTSWTTTKTMPSHARSTRAACIVAPRTLAIVDTPLAELGTNDLLIAVEGSGVCGSHHAVWQGQPWFTYPLPAGAPGHEGWGEVIATGDTCRQLLGRRVAYLSEQAFALLDIASADQVVPLPDHPSVGLFPGEAVGCAINI
ncbi:MAG: alcohol dehydrogenase catalytic domain-containing protein, partial [Bdellovibrionales bacterium]|nr:alcohol dehydrogenase catalytic domain-containing protein [Bdellovibrionales bacterium]